MKYDYSKYTTERLKEILVENLERVNGIMYELNKRDYKCPTVDKPMTPDEIMEREA